MLDVEFARVCSVEDELDTALPLALLLLLLMLLLLVLMVLLPLLPVLPLLIPLMLPLLLLLLLLPRLEPLFAFMFASELELSEPEKFTAAAIALPAATTVEVRLFLLVLASFSPPLALLFPLRLLLFELVLIVVVLVKLLLVPLALVPGSLKIFALRIENVGDSSAWRAVGPGSNVGVGRGFDSLIIRIAGIKSDFNLLKFSFNLLRSNCC